MLVGYARVSTDEQSLDSQRDALEKAGCSKIFTDKASGSKSDRPGLTEALEYVREGDTLVVCRLDRLGRSMKDLIGWVNILRDKSIEFRSLAESLETESTAGKLTFHIFAALAEFERNLISDRTRAGLAAARARGRMGGRRPLLDAEQQQLLVHLHQTGVSIGQIMKTLKISQRTLYRYLKQGTGAPESP